MLTPPNTDIDIKERSPIALAFVGDSVLELLVRARLVAQSRMPAGKLHRQAVQLVSAKAQAGVLPLLEEKLTQEEADVLRRGRNASKASVAKSASVEEYRASTGIEALFGWLYLQEMLPRIEELFAVIWQNYEGKSSGLSQQ